ncbi:hypothetical protein ACIRYZ_38975 [Kitasatospora sp. NPDC101155]|uniref:hypothetical protein n=1 Tax=Kitasatospora sp. NPDC101155 TaxID=3364097 RepID=UPI00381819DE
MNLAELENKHPEYTAKWRDAGIELSDADNGRFVSLHHQGEAVAIVRDFERRPDLVEFAALITEEWPVAFPGGFLPDDPIKARDGERQRWLPKSAPAAEETM